MNILILTSHLDIGGIPRYVLNLAKSLSDKGNTVFVGSAKIGVWQRRLMSMKNVYLIPLPIKTKSITSPKIIFSLVKLIPLVKSQKIDIIHSNTRVTQCLGYLLYKVTNVPYISTFHGCYRPHLFRKLFKFAGVKSIAVSRFVQEHLIKSLGIDPLNIATIYNGVDLDNGQDEYYLKSYSKELKKKIKGNPVIGMVCRLSPEKNVSLIIKAMPLILKRYPDAQAVVLGRGREEDKLKGMVRKINLQERVVFLNNIPSQAVIPFFDIFISLTLGEPFGLSVIEAQVSKIPVVVTPSGALTETIKDRVTGLVLKDFTPQNILEGISEILENKKFKEKIVLNAFNDVKDRFSLEIMGEQTQDLYRTVFKSMM